MPLLEVTLKEGRSPEKKAELIKNRTETVVETLSSPLATVRVLLREIPASHWGVAGKVDD